MKSQSARTERRFTNQSDDRDPMKVEPGPGAADVVVVREPVYLNGLVFKRMTTLTLWGVVAAVAFGVNLLLYGWAQLNIGWFDEASVSEQTSLGGHLVIYGLVFAGGAVALLHGARAHPRRMNTPWLLLAAVAVIHLLLGLPMLTSGISGGGDGGLGLLFWVNPLTYAAAIPSLVTVVRRSNWPFVLPRMVMALNGLALIVGLFVAARGTI